MFICILGEFEARFTRTWHVLDYVLHAFCSAFRTAFAINFSLRFRLGFLSLKGCGAFVVRLQGVCSTCPLFAVQTNAACSTFQRVCAVGVQSKCMQLQRNASNCVQCACNQTTIAKRILQNAFSGAIHFQWFLKCCAVLPQSSCQSSKCKACYPTEALASFWATSFAQCDCCTIYRTLNAKQSATH